MSIASWATDLIGGGGAKIVDSLAGAAKKFITTDQDRMAFELDVQKSSLDLQKLVMDAEEARLKDVQDARALYGKDATIQKVFAMTFLFGYLALTALMLWIVIGWIGKQQISIPDWCVALISTVYGGITAKISTITDFFFGSSKGSHDKDEAISATFKASASQAERQ
jgi:hypothetical protein